MGFSHMPRGTWNIGMNYQQDKYNVGVQGHGTVALPGNLPTNTYWVMDTAINYNVTKDTKAFFTITNMFNRYYAVYGDDTKIMDVYTCPGRNYQIGIQYQF